MTKYATQRKYQPYIDIIMDDLGLTGKVELDWVFATWQRRGGDAKLYSHYQTDGKFIGRVRIDKTGSHTWTIEAIMHELKHIQQFVEGRLGIYTDWETYTTKRGKIKSIPYRLWDGVKIRHYDLMPTANGGANIEYLNLPWEIDARAYEKLRTRLFPNDRPQLKKQLVGKAGNVTFYKVKG